ncbi:MAG: hypothetical protein QT02_C0005G0024 [archaeon GW2011_AR9]|nr:MAG: hypothetical protein QT02_C0005G0024 [archaeon GW2011_AR9]
MLSSSAFASPASAHEEPQTTVQVYQDNTPEQVNVPQEEKLSLTLRYGFLWRKGENPSLLRYTVKGSSLGINGYLVGIRFLEENPERTAPEKISVIGLELEGTRTFRTYEADIMFGYELYRISNNFLNLSLAGQIIGGMLLDTNYFEGRMSDGQSQRIPGNMTLDFLLGGGLQGEAAFHLPVRWTAIPLSMGGGGTLEYLSEQVSLTEPYTGLNGEVHLFLRIARNEL